MTSTIALTSQEKAAIASLKKLAKTWPKSLWLFSASGTLCVMQKKADGERARIEDGIDQEYVVTEIKIENDGGDW